MESHDIVKELLKRVPAKQVASELGVSLSLVYKWAEAPIVGSGASNPIDRVEVLTRLTDDMAPIEWLCSRFGGTFEKHAAPGPVTGADLILSISKIMVELGRVLSDFSTASGSGKLTPAKAREIRARWEKAKKLIEAFILAAEQGHYSRDTHPDGENVPPEYTVPRKITPTLYKRSLNIMPEPVRVPGCSSQKF